MPAIAQVEPITTARTLRGPFDYRLPDELRDAAIEVGVSRDMVGLAEWVAAEYCSTLARALGLVLPPGASRRLGGRRRGARAPLRHLTVGARRPDPPVLTGDQGSALRAINGEL